jgi:hypothetical protein
MPKRFSGVVNLDVRDSVADWTPFREEPAPANAPNVLIVLYDDTGLAAWSPYGGRISMPTMQRLADNGLTYTQWHTTALCSPTRSFSRAAITIKTASPRSPWAHRVSPATPGTCP